MKQPVSVNAVFRQLSREKKTEIIERMVGDLPHEYVRDWLIADGAAFKAKVEPSVIMHLPSGLWKGFRLPYDVAVEMLKAKPEADSELLKIIYRVG